MFVAVVSQPELVVTGLLTGLGIYGLIRFFMRRQGDGADVNYTPLEAVTVALAIFFGTQVFVAVLAALVGSMFNLSTEQINTILETSSGWQFAMIATVQMLTAWLIYAFLRRRRTPLRAIGVVAPRLRDIGYALFGFVVYFGVYALIVFRLLDHYFPQIDTSQKQELGFSTSTVGPELIFIFVSLVVLPPLIEELVVRGFMYTGLRTKLPKIMAAIVASLVFGAAHLQWGSGNALLWTAAADTFTLSLVLIWLREKTGSLWPGIGVHFIKNGLAFMALFIFKVT